MTDEQQQKPMIPPPPLEGLIDEMWKARVGRGGKEDFAKAARDYAAKNGIVDRLTPGFAILRPDDERLPGEVRTKLATEGIVMIQCYFQEAPRVMMQIPMPIDEYDPEQPPQLPQELVVKLLNVLVNNGMAAAEAEAQQSGPKLIVPMAGRS